MEIWLILQGGRCLCNIERLIVVCFFFVFCFLFFVFVFCFFFLFFVFFSLSFIIFSFVSFLIYFSLETHCHTRTHAALFDVSHMLQVGGGGKGRERKGKEKE